MNANQNSQQSIRSHLFILILFLFPIGLSGGDKIILLDRYGQGFFKNGSSFIQNGWTVVNGGETNRWELGAPGETGGRRAIISTDGGQTWGFDPNSPSTVHFYRDISIPADAEEVYLTLFGTGKVTPLFDEMRVYIVPTSTPVVAGATLPFAPLDLKINERLQKLKSVITYEEAIDVNPGDDIRLVFTWTNSGNGMGVQPGIATSIIGLSYTRRNPLKDKFGFQNPKPQGNDQKGALAVNSGSAIITGDAGTVGKTTNGGQSWSFVHAINSLISPLVSPILSGNDIYAVAQPNLLLRSMDNGDSWETQSQINTDNTQVNSIAASGQTFNAVGQAGNVYHSTDGGNSWTPVNSGVFSDLQTVTFGFGSTTEVIAAGSGGTVIKSTDGGASFTSTGVGIPSFNEVREVDSYDTSNYVAAAIGGLYRSTDGGANWSQITGTNGFALYGVDIKDSNEGIAVGGQGFILHSIDGWNSVSIQTSDQYDVHQETAFFPNSNNVFIAGASGTLLLSTNSAGSFTRISDGPTWDLNDVYFTPPNVFDPDSQYFEGWAAGNNGTVLQTFDAGLNWTPRSTGVTGNLQAITSNGAGLVMAVGSVGQNVRSVNNGQTWQTMNIPVTLGLNDIHQIDSLSAIAVGNFGTIAITTDGGQNWTAPATGISSSLNGVDVIADSVGGYVPPDSFTAITVGTFGSIYKTTDGGMNWDLKPTPGNSELRAVEMTDGLYGHAVGVGGVVLRTTDGGETWVQFSAAASQTLTGVSFIGPNIGVVAARNGTLLRTLDGAASWDTLASPTTNELNAVIMFDPYSATAVGESGTIINAQPDTIIVITTIEGPRPTVMPSQFVLEQNYPNPFNPATTIRYHLLINSRVILKIYNTLGQEVRTLVNAFQTAGNKSVVWDGRNDQGDFMSSGIYIYSIVTGENASSKKMLFLK